MMKQSQSNIKDVFNIYETNPQSFDSKDKTWCIEIKDPFTTKEDAEKYLNDMLNFISNKETQDQNQENQSQRSDSVFFNPKLPIPLLEKYLEKIPESNLESITNGKESLQTMTKENQVLFKAAIFSQEIIAMRKADLQRYHKTVKELPRDIVLAEATEILYSWARKCCLDYDDPEDDFFNQRFKGIDDAMEVIDLFRDLEQAKRVAVT